MEEKHTQSGSIIPYVSTTLAKAKNSIAIINKVLIERNPEQKILLLTKAIELINEKLFKEAISVLDELIFLDCLNKLSYFHRGVAYYKLKIYVNAIKDFSKFISNESDEHDKPSRNNENGLGKEPNLRDAYFFSGMCKYYLSIYSDAIQDFDKAIEIDPSKSDAYIHRGFAKNFNKDYVGVLFDENKLKELIPNFSFKRYGYHDIKQTIESLDKYNYEIINNPSDSNAFRNRGAIKFNAHDYQGAFDDICKAIELNPKDSLAYCFRALIFRNPNFEQDNTKALKDLTTAISISPDVAIYYLERAELRNGSADSQEIIEDCSMALSLDNSLARAYIFRGWAKEKLFGLKYEENDDIHQYEKMTGEDMSGIIPMVNGNKKLYAI
jgi:tetratricopeptide (TPR) repeat protein